MAQLTGDSQLAFFAILLAGLAYAVAFQLVTQLYGKPARVKEIQKQINETNKAYSAAVKAGNKEETARLEKEMAGMGKLTMEMMKLQFIPLLFVLPLIYIVPGLMRDLFPTFVIVLPISLPVPTIHFPGFPASIFDPSVYSQVQLINWRAIFGPVGWWWITAIFGGLAIQGLKSAKERIFARKKGAVLGAGTGPVAAANKEVG